MKRWKSLIALTVCLLLVLTACGTGGKSDNAGPENPPSGPASNEPAGGSSEPSAEPVTIRIVIKDVSASNPLYARYFDTLEAELLEHEGLHVQFEIVELPQGNYAENLNLLLLGGDIPDLIYFQGGDQPIAAQGLLEDLRPYIENSKYLKGIMMEHNVKRIENYPYLLWIKPVTPKVPVVRADWFNELSTGRALLDNPTVDNYYAFFRELVDSGKAKYGITVAGDLAEIDFIFNEAFGITSTWLKKDDGTYEHSLVSEAEKNKLAFYNRLYREGLLDNEYMTKQWDTKEDAFYKGDAGVVVGTAGKVLDLYEGRMKELNGDQAGLVVLPPAKGVSQGFGATDVTKESRGFAISALSEHKDIVFRVLDFLAGPEGQTLDRLGFEGQHYNVVDGKAVLTEAYFSEWYASFWEPIEVNTSIPVDGSLLGPAGQESLEISAQFFKEDNNFAIPEEYVATWDALSNLYKEYAADIISGKRPVDDFAKFVEAWYANGGRELADYANSVLK
ncbi:MAG: ABC transporter substrate-binding protein [Thermobacillus sp. ZCTH02-B1]|uniref:extracellular solute-binding protein n=1 Tax=Thermobacillus sp. ZCTH02-B1 TaxID=1858795 RepID=UPI000B58480D|nr:extracellular solute-binding protein [Thermobacillus sp. ZCTH02-B1]OUM97231.1 MAG: ABC transporter substrate-binding protein [Thermobacillus sp. ZCTH02-B1]